MEVHGLLRKITKERESTSEVKVKSLTNWKLLKRFTKIYILPSPSQSYVSVLMSKELVSRINSFAARGNHTHSCLLSQLSLSNISYSCCIFLLILSAISIKRAIKIFVGKQLFTTTVLLSPSPSQPPPQSSLYLSFITLVAATESVPVTSMTQQ